MKDNDKANATGKRRVRISTCVVRDDVPKVVGQHLIFKSSIAGIKMRLLIDNGSEAKLIDEFFVREHKISTFKLEKALKFTLGNGEVVQRLNRG